eukprot:Awhi_evm1s171
MTARQYLSAVGTVFLEVGFASVVVLARFTHQLLGLKSKKQEYSWVIFTCFQLITGLAVSIYQTEVGNQKLGTAMFYTHIVNFLCSWVNLIVYSYMYLKFRHLIIASTEVSFDVAMHSARTGQAFGWFVFVYGLFLYSYFWVFFGTVADLGDFYSEVLYNITCLGAMTYTALRFMAVLKAITFFHPPWCSFFTSTYPQLVTNRSAKDPFFGVTSRTFDLSDSASQTLKPMITKSSIADPLVGSSSLFKEALDIIEV